MRIIYIPLEPYESRYSLQLLEWNRREFERLGIDYKIIYGQLLTTSKDINTGVVLDAHQRPYQALTQIAELIQMLHNKELKSTDFILFEDMFHPGIEALAYTFNLTEASNLRFSRPLIGMRCLAQTIDPDDFVHYTGMADWMRKYEEMVCRFIDIVFVASEEMLAFMTSAGWNVNAIVTGLPFGKNEVLERVDDVKGIPFDSRDRRVAFTSRIADEKQPEFYIAVAREYKKRYLADPVTFSFLSGTKLDSPLVVRAAIEGIVETYPMLSKNEYYKALLNTRIVFNCALQDWVSNTVSEADALGCNTLFPAYRSFPEVFNNDHTRLYVPWSVDDAVDKLRSLIRGRHTRTGEISNYQDKTIERTVEAIQKALDFKFSSISNYPGSDISYRKRIVEKALKGLV